MPIDLLASATFYNMNCNLCPLTCNTPKSIIKLSAQISVSLTPNTGNVEYRIISADKERKNNRDSVIKNDNNGNIFYVKQYF